jgi:hypothetical protein
MKCLVASEESTKHYPFDIAIKTALRSSLAVRGLVTTELEPLLMPQILAVRETIVEVFDVKLDTSTAIAKNLLFVGMLHANFPTGLVDCQNLSPSLKNESRCY